MQRWLEKLNTRHVQRRQRSLERWEKQRAQGEVRFIFRMALTVAAVAITANDIFDYFNGGVVAPFNFWGRTIRYVLSGAFMAFTCWVSMEGKYKMLAVIPEQPPRISSQHSLSAT